MSQHNPQNQILIELLQDPRYNIGQNFVSVVQAFGMTTKIALHICSAGSLAKSSKRCAEAE